MKDKATLTHRVSLSLGHCLWPSAGGEMALVEEVGVQGMAKGPEARRCPRGFGRVACMYVSGVQGGPWWGWTTGCSHLLKTGQRRHRGRSNEAEQARQEETNGLGRYYLLYETQLWLYVKHLSPLFMTAYVALYVSE